MTPPTTPPPPPSRFPDPNPDLANLSEADAYPPVKWKAPDPRQLPTLREHLVDRMHDPVEIYHQTGLMAAGAGTVNPYPQDPKTSAMALLEDESRRLEAARLYSITPEMTDFARQAGQTLPGWNVRREDVPCTTGFAVFGEPMGWYIKENDPHLDKPAVVSIVAVSWGPTAFGTDENLWITFWSATNFDTQTMVMREKMGLPLAQAREQAYIQRGELTWDNEVMLNHDRDGYNVYDGWALVDVAEEQLAIETTASWVNTLRAAWLLMKQPKMTATEEHPQPKTYLRHVQRDRLNLDTSPVRVVRLHAGRRRPTSAGIRDGYTHTVRYPVTGHWREQPYPSRGEGVTERIWIDEHWRGDKANPVRIGKSYTVHLLDRPPG